MVATNEEFSNPVNFGVKDKVVRYGFGYVKDDLGTSGNIPGIYIEFKEPWLNPSNFEQMVYNELKMENVTGFAEKLNMNIIAGGEEPESILSTKTVKLTLVTRMEKLFFKLSRYKV